MTNVLIKSLDEYTKRFENYRTRTTAVVVFVCSFAAKYGFNISPDDLNVVITFVAPGLMYLMKLISDAKVQRQLNAKSNIDKGVQ